MGQFVHLLRRNVPMIYIVENNGVYGLTKGQFSATADLGSKLKTGVVNDLPAIDLCALAIELGCGYVARSFSGDMKQLVALLKGALAHRGTALLDVISPVCHLQQPRGLDEVLQVGQGPRDPDPRDRLRPLLRGDRRSTTTRARRRTSSSTTAPTSGCGSSARTTTRWTRGQALGALQESRTKQEFLTGLIYVEPTKKDFLELSGLSRDPIVTMPESKLRPPRQALEEIMESLK